MANEYPHEQTDNTADEKPTHREAASAPPNEPPLTGDQTPPNGAATHNGSGSPEPAKTTHAPAPGTPPQPAPEEHTAAYPQPYPAAAHANPAPNTGAPTPYMPPAQQGYGAYPPPAAGAVISARGLIKSYGPNTVLRGVSLDIYPGESVAIMGPSGSGKTTLLHVLSGIIKADAGTVHINTGTHNTGHVGAPTELSSLTEKQRTALRAGSFGFIFQQGLLVPELTTEENVALAAMLAGTPREQASMAATHLLSQLGLGTMLQRRIGELSGGQAQRVAIARSQVTGAPITFADEPTGALDTATAQEVMNLLLALIPQQGKTLVIVTHDPNIAAQCSRTIHLLDGQIVHDSQHPAQPRQEGTH
ncbi:ABC transporter ATP-binding protein [Rothia aeria]|uniref:ABC transporter ATP-binding protein n=1 Tax=Rothia aeria TaxID=172042 RepID=UPI00241C4393|nr:ATP-binding cassette domain-containing protein [Rothia aeria]